MNIIYKEFETSSPEKILSLVEEGICIDCIIVYYINIAKLKELIASRKLKDKKYLYLLAYCQDKMSRGNSLEAFKAYKKLKKYPPAMYRLGLYYLNKKLAVKKGIALIEKSAEYDYAPAIYELSRIYTYSGNKKEYNIPIDLKKSYQYAEQARKFNYPNALWEKAFHYALGNQHKLALETYERAIQVQSHMAISDLAEWYLKGKNVKKDLNKVLEIYHLGEKAGFNYKSKIKEVEDLIAKSKEVLKEQKVEVKAAPKEVKEPKKPKVIDWKTTLQEANDSYTKNTITSETIVLIPKNFKT